MVLCLIGVINGQPSVALDATVMTNTQHYISVLVTKSVLLRLSGESMHACGPPCELCTHISNKFNSTRNYIITMDNPLILRPSHLFTKQVYIFGVDARKTNYPND